jgi:hypothetical protein
MGRRRKTETKASPQRFTEVHRGTQRYTEVHRGKSKADSLFKPISFFDLPLVRFFPCPHPHPGPPLEGEGVSSVEDWELIGYKLAFGLEALA